MNRRRPPMHRPPTPRQERRNHQRRARTPSRFLDAHSPPPLQETGRLARSLRRRYAPAPLGCRSTWRRVQGTGPDGRVVHADLDRLLTSGGARTPRMASDEATGPARARCPSTHRRAVEHRVERDPAHHLRRRGRCHRPGTAAYRAERSLRRPERARLTMLPFLVRAIVIACGEQPHLNAHYDTAAEDTDDVRRGARRHRHPDR